MTDVKPKALGSIYINASKDADPTVKEKIAQAVQFLKDNKAYLSISVKKASIVNVDQNSNGYIALTGCFNGFKQSDRDKDLYIIPKGDAINSATVGITSTTTASTEALPFV